jgi:uncharacterized membrane protein YkvI
MKTALNSKVIVTVAAVAAAISLVAAFQASKKVQMPANEIQTVTVSAKRMTVEQKMAFDLQSTGMQTIVISAKRLTPAQKNAIDEQDRVWQAATTAETAPNKVNG